MKDDKFLKDMGERICQRRKALGLTQEKLAEQMNVSIQMISNLELGKKAIRPENLAKLCKILDISADYILNGNNYDGDLLNSLYGKLHRLPDERISLVTDIVELCINDKK